MSFILKSYKSPKHRFNTNNVKISAYKIKNKTKPRVNSNVDPFLFFPQLEPNRKILSFIVNKTFT
ncbi:hypothetical protein THF1A12_70178 [Vibrio jasicida]|uniref:Uncharacterized protein n=1 Tax=Vibrio jasicida TaxID=766224 RepID=A0AAU9QWJ1_9VIBR|nr:hypothetical protein THF1A12_70178 [Vibrio jasicida]